MSIRSLLRSFTLALLGATALMQAASADETVIRPRFSDEIVGQGPDLVLIPGLASSRDTWKALAVHLQDHYRLHLIQIAGFAGEAPRDNASGPVLQPTAEAIDAYLREQHLTPATIIGHSLGGTITLYLAENHGEDLKKAMLVDALPFMATLMQGPAATVAGAAPMADAIRSGKSKLGDEQNRRMMATMATADADRAVIMGWSKASDPSVVANALADDMTLDLRPGLGAVTTPLTLVYPDYAPNGAPPGATDGMYRGAYAADTHMAYVRIDKSLHFVMLDQPQQFQTAVDAFLAP